MPFEIQINQRHDKFLFECPQNKNSDKSFEKKNFDCICQIKNILKNILWDVDCLAA